MSMRNINIGRMTLKIPVIYRRVLYTTISVSWITGILFFVLREFVTIEGEFGPQSHPFQFPVLMVHGLAAFFMIIGFGGLLFAHIPYSWRSRRQRLWGLLLITAVAVQVISAYLLYYINGEFSRELIGYIHLIIGISLPFLLATHVINGRNDRKS